MEILVFTLVASYKAHRRQERVIAEPEEFQPFDLQVLMRRIRWSLGRVENSIHSRMIAHVHHHHM